MKSRPKTRSQIITTYIRVKSKYLPWCHTYPCKTPSKSETEEVQIPPPAKVGEMEILPVAKHYEKRTKVVRKIKMKEQDLSRILVFPCLTMTVTSVFSTRETIRF